MSATENHLEGIGHCLVEPVEQLPTYTKEKEIKRDDLGYTVHIYTGSDGYTYWLVNGHYTAEYDKLYRIVEIFQNKK